MNTLDLLFPAKGAALSAANETPAPRHATSKSSEPFAALMNRALARPAPEKNEPANRRTGEPRKVSDSPPHRLTVSSQRPDSRPGRVSKHEVNPPKTADDSHSPSADNSLSSPNPDSTEPVKENNAQDSASGVDPDNETIVAGDASGQDLTVVTAQTLAASAAAQGSAPATDAVKNAGQAAGSAAAIATTGEDSGTPSEISNLKSEIANLGGKELAGDGKEISASASDPAKNAGAEGGAVPIQDWLEKGGISKETTSIAGNLASDKPASALSEASGISAAQQTATMNNADQTNKIAGEPEQHLPGVAVLAASESSPAPAKPAAKPAARVESLDTATSTTNLSNAARPPALAEASSGNLISASSQTDLSLRALDRTHDIVALHAMRLKESGQDSLHVVIKPGSGLQLSLELKQNGDALEVQAVLQRGDFNQLNQHWAELQQRFEERGIRLAPLSGSENTTAGNENFQRQPPPPAEQDSLTTGAFAEFALAGSVAGSAAQRITRTAAYRGWESWA